jgi:ADP-ribosylglycohydrolase
MTNDRESALAGCLLGGALGDALGLAWEGISPRRQARMRRGRLRFAVWPGLGLVSDDTEHAALTAQALALGGGDVQRFQHVLAWRLRLWIAALPPGVGLATGRALWKLWLGFPAGRNGVRSAGNGPAMRAAVIGAYFAAAPAQMLKHAEASARLTHTDIRAIAGAQVVALCAMLACQGKADAASVMLAIKPVLEGNAPGMADFRQLMAAVIESVRRGDTTAAFCERLQWHRGVQGFVVHTVAASAHAWLTHPLDMQAGLASIIECGGDTDSTAAIVGGLIGAGTGREGVPAEWRAGLRDWPWSGVRLETLAAQLASAGRQGMHFPFWPAVFARNLLMLPLVLCHGLRRLLPPY